MIIEEVNSSSDEEQPFKALPAPPRSSRGHHRSRASGGSRRLPVSRQQLKDAGFDRRTVVSCLVNLLLQPSPRESEDEGEEEEGEPLAR